VEKAEGIGNITVVSDRSGYSPDQTKILPAGGIYDKMSRIKAKPLAGKIDLWIIFEFIYGLSQNRQPVGRNALC
jgi:hypothetical protein